MGILEDNTTRQLEKSRILETALQKDREEIQNLMTVKHKYEEQLGMLEGDLNRQLEKGRILESSLDKEKKLLDQERQRSAAESSSVFKLNRELQKERQKGKVLETSLEREKAFTTTQTAVMSKMTKEMKDKDRKILNLNMDIN